MTDLTQNKKKIFYCTDCKYYQDCDFRDMSTTNIDCDEFENAN